MAPLGPLEERPGVLQAARTPLGPAAPANVEDGAVRA